LIDNNLITSHQSGFTPGDSAVNQLDKLNSVHKGYLSIYAASLRSLGFNGSGPIALDVSSIFNISSTSFSVTVICSRPLINISVISGTEVSESLRSAYLQK
jgi:hypothetical protein